MLTYSAGGNQINLLVKLTQNNYLHIIHIFIKQVVPISWVMLWMRYTRVVRSRISYQLQADSTIQIIVLKQKAMSNRPLTSACICLVIRSLQRQVRQPSWLRNGFPFPKPHGRWLQSFLLINWLWGTRAAPGSFCIPRLCLFVATLIACLINFDSEDIHLNALLIFLLTTGSEQCCVIISKLGSNCHYTSRYIWKRYPISKQ